MNEQELHACFTTKEKIEAIKFIIEKLDISVADRGLCYWSQVAYWVYYTTRPTLTNLPTRDQRFPFFHFWFKDAPFTNERYHWFQHERLKRIRYCNKEIQYLKTIQNQTNDANT